MIPNTSNQSFNTDADNRGLNHRFHIKTSMRDYILAKFDKKGSSQELPAMSKATRTSEKAISSTELSSTPPSLH
ncbi:MAG: hypothetical protein A2010_03560 [Nitrospirae bacterium GWD2_57_9]|nr:MAG: hypothetical protein A2010_03560 [Nitrospirae bacterium GWD2_57_9]